MTYPKFVDDGVITEKGQELVNWLESQIAPFATPSADVDINQLNALSGPIKFYYASVSTHMSPGKWLRDFRQSAENAWQIKEDLQTMEAEKVAAAAKLNETSEATNKIEAELKAFKESIAEQIAALEKENEDLKAELGALKAAPAKKSGKAAPVKAEADPETPAEGEATEG